MFPIDDDDVRGASAPIVTWVLIGVNVLAFLYELSLSSAQLEQLFVTYGVVPTQILDGDNLISLLTSMFLHGGWFHIFGNMLFLLVFGDNIEAVLGKVLYPLFYLGGGIVGSIVHVAVGAGSNIPSIGASGAVAAVLGAYIVMFPRSRIRVLIVLGFFPWVTRVAALIFVGVWFLMQFLNGVASLGPATAQTGGVAYWAHVGGFVAGVLVGFIGRSRVPEDFARRRRSEEIGRY